jgi:hypothetical protein
VTTDTGPTRDRQPPTRETTPPVLRVVRGEPTDDEVAALVVAMTARSIAAPAQAPPRSLWRSRGRNIRPAVSPAAGAWRASGLPR